MAWSTLFLLVCPVVANATTYPWVPVSDDDIYVTDNPRVESSVRLEMVRTAQRTLDIAIYDQRSDTAIALPLLKALRDAADRGVKIRFVTAWFPQFATDMRQIAPRYLTDPPARTPIQYLIVGGPEMQPRGWNVSDNMHEKLFIMDGKRLLVSGRGHAKEYLNWIDTAFFIKGTLVEQAKAGYENLWKTTRAETAPFIAKTTWFSNGRKRVPTFKPDLRTMALNAAETETRDRFLHWLALPPTCPANAECPGAGRGRLLHMDFLAQLRRMGRPASVTYVDRIAKLRDPIVDSITERLERPETREARFNMLSPLMHPKLKQAMIRKAKQPGRLVEIFTNGEVAFGEVAPFALPWISGLPDLDDMMLSGVLTLGFVKESPSPLMYLHRKVAIIDDAVYFGSHNFNLPSTVANDEMSFEIESPAFATALRNMHDHSVTMFGMPFIQADVHRQRDDTGLARFLTKPFIGFF